MDPSPPKSWSIHTRPEIIAKYEILHRVGSGAYSDVYRGRRLSDGATVALKEVHDYQSAFREIEALQALKGHPNVVSLIEYFWREDEDAVLVLEFLRTDLASVIAEAKKSRAISVGEVKTWMAQILSGVEACHRMMIVHRDLKPANLLIGEDGSLKLADFGQARILMDTGYDVAGGGENLSTEEGSAAPPQGSASRAEEYLRVLDEVKEGTKNTHEGGGGGGGDCDVEGSCVATCTASDPYEYESYDHDTLDDHRQEGCLTSCVGTRWFRAPELLFGSTDYGLEVDLWSLGCIFGELLTLDPLFPGASDIDQLSKIIDVLGNLTEEVWPGCARLPDYRIISFEKVETPAGIGARLPGRSPEEVSLVKRLVCFDPACRASAAELARDEYFGQEPLSVPISELVVPLTRTVQDDDEDCYGELGSDSDFDDFGSATVSTTNTGFSIQFS